MGYLMNMAAFDRGAKLIDDMHAEERQAKLDARQAEIDARERDRYGREKSEYDDKKAATKTFVGEMKKDVDGSDVDSFFSQRAPAQSMSPGPMAEGAQVMQSADNPVSTNLVAAQPAQPLASMASTVQQPFKLPPEAMARRNMLLAEAEFASKTNPAALPGIKEKLQRFDLGAKASEVHRRVSDMEPGVFGELLKRADLNPQIEVKAIEDGKGGTVLTVGEKKVSLNRQQAADWLTGLYLRDQGDLEGGKAMIASVSKELADASTKYQDALFKTRADNRAETQSRLAINADGRAATGETRLDEANQRAWNAESRAQEEFSVKLRQLEREDRLSPQAKMAAKEVEMLSKAIADGMAKDTYSATSENGKELAAKLTSARLAFDSEVTRSGAAKPTPSIPFSSLNGSYGGAAKRAPTDQPQDAQTGQQQNQRPASKFASTSAEQDRQQIYQNELLKAQEGVRAARTPEETDRAQRNLNELQKEIKSNRISIPNMGDAIAPVQQPVQTAPVSAAPQSQTQSPTQRQAPMASQQAPLTLMQSLNPGGDRSLDAVMQPRAAQLQGMAVMFQQARQKTAQAAQSGNPASVQKAAVEQQQIRGLINEALKGMDPQQAATVLKAAGIN